MSTQRSASSSRARSRASSSTADALPRLPSRSNTVYFDALGIPFDAAAREQLEQHNSTASPDVSEPVQPECERRPSWGWDYVFVFRLPRALKRQLAAEAAAEAHDYVPPEQQNDEHEQRNEDADEEEEDGKSAQRVRERVEILARLSSAGFVFSQLLVPSEQLIFLRLSLPTTALKQAARHVGMELRLLPQFGGGYLEFEPHREHVYVNHELEKSSGSYFAPADRSLLILNVLQSKEHWGCGLNIERLLFDQKVEQVFALHSIPEKRRLVREVIWRQWWNPIREPPFHEIKDYLGARVTFYFVFVSFYARRLLPLGLLSIPVFVVYRTVRNIEALVIVRWVFAIGLVLWTTYFLENWKRRTAMVNTKWGLHDYQEDTMDDTRVQFEGEQRYGFYSKGGFVPLDDLAMHSDYCLPSESSHRMSGSSKALGTEGMGERQGSKVLLPQNPYQDPLKKRNALLLSTSVTSVFVVIVGALTFLLLWFRNEIVTMSSQRVSSNFANAVPGVLNGILTFVFDSIWRSISMWLTRRENHRTNQHFENSLIYKRFAFMFVSNYISLFYIAFVRKYLSNTCPANEITGVERDCMSELEDQMLSLVLTKATIGQVMEIGIPWLTSTLKQINARIRSSKHAQQGMQHGGYNRYVAESKLNKYHSTMEDYSELVMQFGFLVLFGVAFPLAAVVNIVNNTLEVRTDAYKLLELSQRVDADDAADIGAWYAILQLLNVLSVWCNAALLIFTSESLEMYLPSTADQWQRVLYRVTAFFVLEHVLLGIKAAAAALIRDVPNKTRRALARQSFDIARHFDVRWREHFRGAPLLRLAPEQLQRGARYARVFDAPDSPDSPDAPSHG
eukprot:TRINITY_DN957_c0_g1_i2.p1 TRINITY_DN957_c0_g1~~TRINITY_DN957_c0_g1_i2.p1  ORF type:complete len:847 (+),score=149.53 TRINITY_DN957_c0_g1_i2:1650-4190(+)